MNDVNLDIGLDLAQLDKDIKAASMRLKQEFERNKPKIQIDGSMAAGEVQKLSTQFKMMSQQASMGMNEIKSAMAQMIVSGQSGTKEFKAMETELSKLTAEARQLDRAMGQVDDAVDKANMSMDKMGKSGGLKQRLGDIAGSAKAGAIAAGITMLTVALKETIDIGVKYESSLAEFSAITGVSGDALQKFGVQAQELAMKFGGSTLEQITSFKGILSRLGPDLAKSPESLNSITESVNLLAKASGLDAQQSMESLTTAMLQFGIDMKDPVAAAKAARDMINTMAAGAKEGAAEIPQVSEALVVAGATAKNAGVSFEETNAAIQVLATSGKYGAEAGTALRNVLSKLAGEDIIPKEAQKKMKDLGVNIKVVSDTTKPFAERLTELKKIQSDATLSAQLFGVENMVAANALLNGTDALKDFTTKLTGTNVASEQAAINMNTLSARWERFKAIIEVGEIKAFGYIRIALESIVTVLENSVWVSAKEIFNSISTSLESFWGQIKVLYEEFSKLLKGAGEGVDTFNILKDIFQVLGRIIGTYVKVQIELVLIPFRAMIWVATKLMEGINWVKDSFDKLAKSGGIVGDTIKFIWNAFKDLLGVIGGTVEKVLQFMGLLDKKKGAPLNPNFKKEMQEAGDAIKSAADAAPLAVIKPTSTKKEGSKKADNDVDKFLQDAESRRLKIVGETDALIIEKQIQDLEILKEQILVNANTTELEKAQLVGKIEKDILKTKKDKELESAKNTIDEALRGIDAQYREELKKEGLSAAEKSKIRDAMYKEMFAQIEKSEESISGIKAKYQKEEIDLADKTNKAINEARKKSFEYGSWDMLATWKGFLESYKLLYAAANQTILDKMLADSGNIAKDTLSKIDTSSLFAPFFEVSKASTDALKEVYDKDLENLKSQSEAHKISLEEYNKQRTERDKKYQDDVKSMQSSMVNSWRGVNDAISGMFDDMKKRYVQNLDKMKEEGKSLGAAVENVGVGIGLSFLQAGVQGKDMWKSLSGSVLQALPGLIAAYSAEIFAFYASLGPWMIPAALATIGIVYAMAQAAYGADEGVPEGIKKGYNKPKSYRDTIPIWVRENEILLRPEAGTKENKEFFKYANRGGSITNYMRNREVSNLFVSNDGQISELRSLNEKVDRLTNTVENTRMVEMTSNIGVKVEDNRKIKVEKIDWTGR